MKIDTVINVQDDVIDLYERTKEQYSFTCVEELIAYAVGLGIQQINYGIDLSNVIGTSEAAEILDLSPDHVKLLCRQGKIKSKLVGKTWIIDKTSLKSSK